MSIASLPMLVGRILKGRDAELRISLEEFKGRGVVDVRIWEPGFGPANTMLRSKKGVTLDVSKLPALAELIRAAEAQARELGLLSDEGATP